MKAIIAAAAMSVLGTTQVSAESIEIRRNGQTPSVVGKADNFSGHAVVSPLLPPNESTRANLGQVDFAPGARTAWHTHPAGQLLIVTAGKGWVQEEGKARQDIAPRGCRLDPCDRSPLAWRHGDVPHEPSGHDVYGGR